MESVYVETSVISYLTSRPPSRDLVVATHQQVTWDWWERKRRGFELFISELVLDEVRPETRMPPGAGWPSSRTSAGSPSPRRSSSLPDVLEQEDLGGAEEDAEKNGPRS